MNNYKLSVIIVSWNTVDLLRQCLTSLLEEDSQIPFEVIVVDNASSDGSTEMVKKEFPHVRLIQNTNNAGFSKANNQAVKIAKGEYILLLNSDTIIHNNLIFKEWIAFMDKHPETGASGCRLIFPDGSHQVGDAGYRPSFKTVLNWAFFLTRVFPHHFKGLFLSYGKLNHEIAVDWISGAAFLVQKSIIPRVGLLDEDTFMYAEDIEWGCRIRSFGYRVSYLPYLEIVHLQGASSKKQEDPDRFSVLWLEIVRRRYRFFNKKEPIIFYDLAVSAAFLLRSLLYYFMSLQTKDVSTKLKSKRMFNYMRFTILNIGK